MNELNIALIYNIIRGYEGAIDYDRLAYGLALIEHAEFQEAMHECDNLEDAVDFALSKNVSLFNETSLEQIKKDMDMSLSMGMIQGYFILEENQANITDSNSVLPMNESIALGRMLRTHSLEELARLFTRTAKKIVVLDGDSLGDDISFDVFKELGYVVVYGNTSKEETLERIQDASYVLVNKVILDENILEQCKQLEYIGILATGTNNVDLEYCKSHGIVVRNVANYSTPIVAQHTMALALSLIHHLGYYNEYVHSGDYSKSGLFTMVSPSFYELEGKTWGIVGLGNIGKRVAGLASAFGCHVVYYSTSGNHIDPDYPSVSFDELLENSDIISIHAPLNENTYHLFDQKAFSRMKRSSYFINVGRGPIVKEEDLCFALKHHMIAGAALDVYDKEPLSINSELLGLDNVILTPHNAWGSIEARNRLLSLAYERLKTYIGGEVSD